MLNGTLTAQARYMTLYMVPLIPYTAFIFYKLWILIKKWQFILLFTFYFLYFNMPVIGILKYSESPLRYEDGFHESVEYVKKINSGYFYVDNEINYGSGNWIVLSRINNHSFNLAQIKQSDLKYLIDNYYRKYNKGLVSFVDNDSDIEEVWNEKIFDELLDFGALTHIMLFPEGKLSHKLNFSNHRESYRGKTFIRKFNKNGYRVYQVDNHKDKQ